MKTCNVQVDQGRSGIDYVFEAITLLTGREAKDLPPLTQFIDGDALNRLFGQVGTTTLPLQNGLLSFQYADLWVTVACDGADLCVSVADWASSAADPDDLAVDTANMVAHSESVRRSESFDRIDRRGSFET